MKEWQVGEFRAFERAHKQPEKAPDFLTQEATEPAWRFHHTLDTYRETPLASLRHRAEAWGLRGLLVKDESPRFGLNAFKGLGGIYALTRAICQELGLEDVSFSALCSDTYREKLSHMVFVTATDGNHGKGVAWAAAQLGCEAHVYLPVGSVPARAQAIADAGAAEAKILDLSYDDTVRYAARMAEENGWKLVQDTSWPGYEDIPRWIVQGYTTMAREAAEQLEAQGYERPTHVFLQAGVGAMAGGVLGYLLHRYRENPPIFVVVEPEVIPCIYQSARMGDGQPHPAEETGTTIMAGLNCGEPCGITWPVLRDFAQWYTACPDDVTREGMRLLGLPLEGDPVVVSGESGGVTAGLLGRIMTRDDCSDLRTAMGLDRQSVVLLFSTEGDTDPASYREIVGKDKPLVDK